MKGLVLHPLTRQQLEGVVVAPSHATVLIGPTGSGKQTLATKLAESILGLTPEGLNDYPYKMIIRSEEGKAIGIEAVRQLEHFLSLKVPTNTEHNRVIIIEDAHQLTTEAQNALLKTLEEPPKGTIIIMSASHEQSLLPTIRSRAQAINVKRPDQESILTYFADRNFGQADIKQAYAISAGLVGLMDSLLEEEEHPLTLATAKARQLLSQSAYERLLNVDELAKNRELAINTVAILQQMAHVSLQSASGKAALKWQSILSASYKCAEDLSMSGQPKLALTELMLNL
ncbi:MAG: AAA family ATPase [Patescibacteria group bacterium]